MKMKNETIYVGYNSRVGKVLEKRTHGGENFHDMHLRDSELFLNILPINFSKKPFLGLILISNYTQIEH